MKKLIQGIVNFRKNASKGLLDKFEKLANGQSPDAYFIACSDSRVVPNTFASSDPGDLFVHRNVGNLIPNCCDKDHSCKTSEMAGLEFALGPLGVSDIIICGHSECGAMQALIQGRERLKTEGLRNWLGHGEKSITALKTKTKRPITSEQANELSRQNVLCQLENLKSYPMVQERLERQELQLHGWWFDIKNADVYIYDQEAESFVVLDEKRSEYLLANLN